MSEAHTPVLTLDEIKGGPINSSRTGKELVGIASAMESVPLALKKTSLATSKRSSVLTKPFIYRAKPTGRPPKNAQNSANKVAQDAIEVKANLPATGSVNFDSPPSAGPGFIGWLVTALDNNSFSAIRSWKILYTCNPISTWFGNILTLVPSAGSMARNELDGRQIKNFVRIPDSTYQPINTSPPSAPSSSPLPKPEFDENDGKEPNTTQGREKICVAFDGTNPREVIIESSMHVPLTIESQEGATRPLYSASLKAVLAEVHAKMDTPMKRNLILSYPGRL
ncbi:hypothetical protein B0H13DRAFT_1917661 [Mycena leptocephala]|nr:hypothetical protein B0H13DRAFT_1917661 [Mycena leptocephala]